MLESNRANRFFDRGTTTTVTLFRIALGAILAAHGWSKLSDIAGTTQSFAHLGMPAPQVLVYLAIAGEFMGGLGLLVGLLTHVAALGPVCTMAVAILTVHLGHGLFAKDGGYEYPLVLLLASLFFAFNGAGPFSIDALLEKGALARFSRAPRVRQPLPSRPL